MKRSSTSSLLLMEIILSALFLSLSAIVCVRFFMAAHRLNEETTDTTAAILVAQNLAESYYAAEDDDELLSLLKSVYPSAEFQEKDGSFVVCFDAAWRQVASGSEAAVYEAQLTRTDTRPLEEASINVTALPSLQGPEAYRKGAFLYWLSLQKHVAQKGGEP